MKLCYVTFTCVLMLAGIACKKPKPLNTTDTQLYYIETQCSSNPWNRLVAVTDSKKIKSWLHQNGITALKITITGPPPNGTYCAACSCPTGRIIWVVFYPSDHEKAKALGFLKP